MIIVSFPNCQNFPFQTVKISLLKLSKFLFSNCQNFPFQTVKFSLFKLSKFPFSKLSKFLFSNCQNFSFQTVKISLFKTVKISLFKLSKFLFSNCQNFSFQTVKITLSWLARIFKAKQWSLFDATLYSMLSLSYRILYFLFRNVDSKFSNEMEIRMVRKLEKVVAKNKDTWAHFQIYIKTPKN
jgi:hypothetical protein